MMFENLLADLTAGDEAKAEAASIALAQKGEPAFNLLQPLLASALTDQRWWAIRTLARMPSPQEGLLIRALGDPASEVRAAAALALSEHPTEAAVGRLILVLGDADSIVGTLATSALGSIGKPAVVGLLEAFHAGSKNVRIFIMQALAEIGDHRAIPIMLKATESDSALLDYWAREGLERLGLDMIYMKLT